MDISVIISVYNGEGHIISAVNSALAQAYPSGQYEVIVVDDGSTDRTLHQLDKLSGRIQIISKPNTGLADSINVGINRAKGDNIVRLDADDTFEPDILAREIRCLKQNRYVAVGCYRREIDTESGSSKIVQTEEKNIFGWIAAGIMFRKELLIEIGLYKNLLFEEYDILLRVAKRGKIGVVKAPLYNYYLHGQNMTLKNDYWVKGVKEFMAKWDAKTLKRYGFHKEFGNLLEDIGVSKNKG